MPAVYKPHSRPTRGTAAKPKGARPRHTVRKTTTGAQRGSGKLPIRGRKTMKGGRGRGGGRRSARPAVSEDSLDQAMENYWKDSGNDEMLKKVKDLNEEAKKKKLESEAKKLDDEFEKYKSQAPQAE